jgi:hypothetical protein
MDKLPVFISWSGERSLAVAKHIKTWLPDVVRNAEPWLSKEDLRKGLQWLPELNKNLGAAGFGLSVITADNKDAPWLLFEAGAITKALPDKYCCPLLCDLKQADISGPFANFQSTVITKKEDMLQLVKTMNDASGESKVDEDRLSRWFSGAWDEFCKNVNQALAAKLPKSSPAKVETTDRELLEELLSTVRRIAIEPRSRTEVLRRRFEGQLIAPPEAYLSEISKLAPEIQHALIAALQQQKLGWADLAFMVKQQEERTRREQEQATLPGDSRGRLIPRPDQPLSELGFSKETCEALLQVGIRTATDLVALTHDMEKSRLFRVLNLIAFEEADLWLRRTLAMALGRDE